MKGNNTELFRKKIFEFYRQNRRNLPWRATTDRYAVMISEIMLQQTQAERVVPKFIAWLSRFPDPVHLASAPLREVLVLWSGLGYNSRAERLHRCAAIITDCYNGIVPSHPDILKKLPGIGDYTSRSIPVFADNYDIAAVDTNIRRIFIHEFGLSETISAFELQKFAEEILPLGQSRDWHNALMDYGALVLTSKKSGIRPVTRQSRFEGSKRWYRSRLLKELLQSHVISMNEIEEKYGDCPWNIGEIINQLIHDGLIEYQQQEKTNPETLQMVKIKER